MPALVPLTHRPQATARMYCLPPGGSGPEYYQPWADLLPTAVEAYAVALPGRGNRRDEPSPTDPGALAAALASLTDDATDPRPFALFGHSFGALLAYETARRLRRTGRREPVLVAFSAFPAPHQGELDRLLATLLTSGLNAFTDMVGPVPAEILEDSVAVTSLCTPFLADLVLALHHRHHDEPPLQVPLALYGGDADPLVPPDCLERWNDLFTTPATPYLFAGRHTYPQDQTPALVRRLAKDLQMAAR
ncbi:MULTISPECIES: alpha/beta fold hydrolase [unclassified Streptomyces]|uniref:thioesterase II family protein n=1 Tax=unclassified Streptomyces TaxID=2593676 RepID=UPI002E81E86D|nr:alpha/beta fold hydrolase [Streptomyces sp. NBC_00589]WTI42057.1 alpha/beta fold hydrolase [Streptomyces sp. NBC_00775]WUB24260.1 alpha/beta fold hydrolase [Streptomyces sp. NBC_00589]